MTEDQKSRFSEALSRLADDEETLQMLATIVAEDAPGVLRLMNEHAEGGDMDAYAKSAHAMKGLLSTFETGEPVSEFQPAIDAAREGDLATTNTLHQQLKLPIESLIEEIKAIT